MDLLNWICSEISVCFYHSENKIHSLRKSMYLATPKICSEKRVYSLRNKIFSLFSNAIDVMGIGIAICNSRPIGVIDITRQNALSKRRRV